MKQTSLFKNYQNDLIQSRFSPLLIEVNQAEMVDIAKKYKNKPDVLEILARNIYDENTNGKTTNVLAINTDNWMNSDAFILLEVLIDQLNDEIKTIKNIEIVKNFATWGLSTLTGGMLNKLIAPYLDKGVDFLFDELGEYYFRPILESAVTSLDLSSKVTDSLEDVLHDSSADILGDFADKLSKRRINLTAEAKEKLKVLLNDLSNKEGYEVFQLAFQLVLATCIESPKVLFINNPHKLDDNSLAVISLLLAYAKHRKDEGKHIGVSIVYLYSDPKMQPYSEVVEEWKDKKLLLDGQRRFAQRYRMLERPNSDVPVIAVKSSLFVGRESDLTKLACCFNSHEKFTVSAVSGEPGIGKTTLINKHLEQVATERTVVLTMVNEGSHYSTNTGLSSLEKSIAEETSRLNLLKSWKEKSADFFTNIDKKQVAVDLLGKVFTGADKAFNAGLAIKARIDAISDIENILGGAHSDLEEKSKGSKEDHFLKLDKAIEKLYQLSEPNDPVVLFIDDIQWIDNSSSEYILTRLAKLVPLYVVTSIRPSDGATLLKEKSMAPSLYAYTLSFFKAISVQGHEGINFVDGVIKPRLFSLPLAGFDSATLEELISCTIEGSSDQAKSLSDSIINEVAGEGATSINSLFAIESINILCDARLYEGDDTDRLVLTSPLRINDQVSDISLALHRTFNKLKSKYEASLSHVRQGNANNGFNLMAYAVLEERLHLLKVYFAEHGNAAVNTLLLSSLLGAPFSSMLVKQVLEAISITEEPSLLPLRDHINQSKDAVTISDEHYAVIDEVYEILRRQESTPDKFLYYNSLLNIFLDKQREYVFSVLVEKSKTSFNKLYELILQTIETFEEKRTFYGHQDRYLTENEFQDKLFVLQSKFNVLRCARKVSPEHWGAQYIECIDQMEQCLNASTLWGSWRNEERLEFRRTMFLKDPEGWVKHYSNSLHRVSFSGKHEGSTSLELSVNRKAEIMECLREHHNVEPQIWDFDYAQSLEYLAITYKELSRAQGVSSENAVTHIYEAIRLFEEALEIREKNCYTDTALWVTDYCRSLGYLSRLYSSAGSKEKSVAFAERKERVARAMHRLEPSKWTILLAGGLSDLITAYYYHADRKEEATALADEQISLYRELHWDDPFRWGLTLQSSLRNLARWYRRAGRMDEAMELESEMTTIVRTFPTD